MCRIVSHKSKVCDPQESLQALWGFSGAMQAAHLWEVFETLADREVQWSHILDVMEVHTTNAV
jgi:hypothetical protein